MGLEEYPRRGDVFLASLDPTPGSEIKKTRPVLVISNNTGNELAQTITVIPISSGSQTKYPFESLVSSGESGLLHDSKAKCEQIRFIDKQRIVKKLGHVTDAEMSAAEEALLIHLGMY